MNDLMRNFLKKRNQKMNPMNWNRCCSLQLIRMTRRCTMRICLRN
jgi:hypothetical protein